ncbi:MAG: hypothetical protein KDA58_08535 [Planctomycetaceae bacterium]|nr:hypothetical protein [Planctomycetaceae bacterium]
MRESRSADEQHKVDADQLNLLSVFHFVAAGLSVLGILFLILHYMMFQTMMNNPRMWKPPGGGPGPEMPPQEFLNLFVWFYVAMGFMFVIQGLLNVASGMFLRSRTNRAFSLVVAGINCLQVPLGTILGVFTIIVLMRGSVRDLYEMVAGNEVDRWDRQ